MSYKANLARRKRIEDAFKTTKFEVLEASTNIDLCLNWLTSKGLYHSRIIPCEEQYCTGEMEKNEDSFGIDNYNFICQTCKSKRELRKGTLFMNFPKIHLVMIFRIIFFYFIEMKNDRETYEDINSYCSQDKKELITYLQVISMFTLIRKLISEDYHMKMNNYKLSGEGELDEALLAHENYEYENQTEKYNKQMWTLGIVERKTHRSYGFTMTGKSFDDINPIVEKYVEKNSIFYHNGMKSYENISESFQKVKVEKGDVDIQTNKLTCMDSLWASIRYYMRKIQGGIVKAELLDTLLPEILLRIEGKREGIPFIDKLIQIIKISYPLLTKLESN